MLDDLTKEIKAQLYERVKSPLFGAFALSWVGWNYRALLGVVSELHFKERMAYLDGLYPTTEDWFNHCVWWPLLTAVLFLVIYPWPARAMYWYWAWQQKELKKVQQRMEDETPITQEEANALRKGGMAQTKEYQSQLKEMAASNKELEERIKLLQEDSVRLELERDQASAVAKKVQEELSQHLAEVLHDGPLSTTEGALSVAARGLQESSKALEAAIDASGNPFPYQPVGHPLPKSASEVFGVAPGSEVGMDMAANNTAQSNQRESIRVESISLNRVLELLTSEGKAYLDQLGNEAAAALCGLVARGGRGRVEDLAKALKMNPITVRHGLSVLVSKAYVTHGSNQYYWLTDTGDSLVVRMHLAECVPFLGD